MMSPEFAGIQAESVSFRYGDSQALNDVSFSVATGSLFGLLGPNGSGKTTLFRLLATLLPVQQGTVSICGHSLKEDPDRIRECIGVTFQSAALDPRLTVNENLQCHGRIYGLDRTVLKQRADDLLSRFEVAERRNTLAGELSGGLRRRVELAKGLLHAPQVLLLDEPSTGLDPAARQRFWDFIHAQREQEDTTIVVATHLMEEAEGCEQLLLLDEGRVVQSGSPTELQKSVPGQRLTIRPQSGQQLRRDLEALLNTDARVIGDRYCFRLEDAATALQQVMAAHAGEIASAEVAQPTLEDVFLEITGRQLTGQESDS